MDRALSQPSSRANRTGNRMLYILTWLWPLVIICQIHWFSQPWLGSLSLIIYFSLNSFWLYRVLKIIALPRLAIACLSLIGILTLVGTLAAAAVMIYTITPINLLVILLLPSILVTVIQRWKKAASADVLSLGRVALHWWEWLAVLLPLIAAAVLAWSSRTDRFIASPWEVLPELFPVLALVAAFFIFKLILSNRSTRSLLILITAFSLVTHSYLFVVYQIGFGGDRWRHMAYESQIIDERPIAPTFYSPEGVELKKIGPVSIPAAAVDSKIGYSFTWGIMSVIGKVTGIDLLYLDIWLLPMLWALASPLLFFCLGWLLFKRTGWALMFAWLPLVFDVYQVTGSITVPNSWSLLVSLAFLVLTLGLAASRIRTRWALMLLPLFIFQYPPLAIMSVLTVLLYSIQGSRYSFHIKNSFNIGLLMLTALAVLAVDTFDQLSVINWAALGNIDSVIRGISRWLLTLLTGQAGGQWLALRNNVSMIWLPVLFWSVAIIGLIRLRHDNGSTNNIWLKVWIWLWGFSAFLTLFAEQFMEGLKLVMGRLAIFQNFFILPFFVLGLAWLLSQRIGERRIHALAALVIGLLFYQNFTGAPTLKTVTGDELRAAEYVQDRYLVQVEKPACVLAEEWPLLALQKVSRNRVQGGGFPIERDFIQSEKDGLFFGLIRRPSNVEAISKRAYELTGADQCLFLFENRFSTDPASLDKLVKALGEPYALGEVYLFELPRPDAPPSE